VTKKTIFRTILIVKIKNFINILDQEYAGQNRYG
jgi:hypothetical protein